MQRAAASASGDSSGEKKPKRQLSVKTFEHWHGRTILTRLYIVAVLHKK